jgi:mannose-1-phosphate guanylyltransferase
MLHAVIMAGGHGTRFWPVSRQDLPKQLRNLYGETSLLQSTVDRFAGLIEADQTWVITNQRLVQAVARQLPRLPVPQIIGEPCKRDTAPCIGLAALLISRRDPEGIMVVTPSDHVIRPAEEFRAAIRKAVQVVQEAPQALVTFGVPPTYPAESFGYIQRGPDWPAPPLPGVYQVEQFREKPQRHVAQEYLAQGNCYWNAGIFVWRVAAILEQLQRLEPQMLAHLSNIAQVAGTSAFATALQQEFPRIQGRSIDYAVMEHASDVAVVEAPFVWDDVGSWQAIARLQGSDASGNTVLGRHLGLDSSNLVVRSDGDHLIVTVGIQDLIVVHTPDATLIVRKDLEEKVRQVVQELEQRGWTEYL